ncbi:MAG: hypothetical protein ACRC2R_25580 [Xenococcaceae cyanobacterium]
MFNNGDLVIHKLTGSKGEICGYGHWIVNGEYLPTLKVLCTETEAQMRTILEDISSAWVTSKQEIKSRIGLTDKSDRTLAV